MGQDARTAVIDVMRAQAMPELAVRTFLLHFDRLAAGESGRLARDQIRPLAELPDAETLQDHRRRGLAALPHTAVIKLNGGLGTSMGLEGAKSSLAIRGGASFLELICRQVVSLRELHGAPVPLLLMNSFRTEAESRPVLARHPDLVHPDLPPDFLQHRVPKLQARDLRPATELADHELAWCPPGHGDLYTALATSGALGRLLEAGFEFAFVSNADNLGAVVDLDLLGFLADSGAPLLLEAADRTEADRKGGHLCRLADGRLALRESAQCPPEEAEEFQDVTRYRYFNTNNLWLHLPRLREAMTGAGEVLALPTLVNRKPLDPRDPSSPQVIQLETAMGAAISVFPGAAAVRVSRRRFSPVKTTSDLLTVRSDAFRLEPDGRVALVPTRNAPPTVVLDDRFYSLIDDFERRFPAGPPSLIGADRFEVEGDVTFSPGVIVRGTARLLAPEGPARVAAGAVLDREVRLQVAPR